MRSLGELILEHLHRPYPYRPAHVFVAGEISAEPADLSPVFRGSFDWHSSVHSHWALVRLLARGAAPAEAGAALDTSFAPERIAGEFAELDRPHRSGFELPYGMAWLLLLGAEVRAFPSWSRALEPLTALAAQRFTRWLAALPMPIRSGEHSQSAFAMTLAFDAARATGDQALAALVEERAREFYQRDVAAPIAWEPSAFDFLSPTLAEADLMRRVLGAEFGPWFDAFAPDIALSPVAAANRSDGKLAHADGLNLSRAWMLRALAAVRPTLAAQADAHASAGLAALHLATYAGTHWLPSFAVYLEHP